MCFLPVLGTGTWYARGGGVVRFWILEFAQQVQKFTQHPPLRDPATGTKVRATGANVWVSASKRFRNRYKRSRNTPA